MQKYIKKFVPLFIAPLLMLASQSSVAEIYKYEDMEGRIHFSDEPLKGNYRLIKRMGFSSQKSRKAKGKINTAAFKANKKRFTPLIESVAKEMLLRPELLHAVIRAESAYDPEAISSKGAVGLMQLMPATAERYGVGANDRNNPEQNLRAGANYLRDLLIQFGFDLKLAVAAYNAGENAVVRSGYQIPNFRETKNYVAKVMRFYKQNRSNKG